MDSRTRTSAGKARPVARVSQHGDSLADRALALVNRTRAGLGVRGLGAGSDEEDDDIPQFNMDFVKELSRVHTANMTHIEDLKKQFDSRELAIVTNGVIGLLDEIGNAFPNSRPSIDRCTDMLRRVQGEELPDSSEEDSEENEQQDETILPQKDVQQWKPPRRRPVVRSHKNRRSPSPDRRSSSPPQKRTDDVFYGVV